MINANRSACNQWNNSNKSDKIECLTKLRLDALKAPVAGQLKIIDNKIKKFDADKKKFDKENKTLWQMYKNYKKK